jgi:hypothetical protein
VADEFLESSLIQEGGALGPIRREAKINWRLGKSRAERGAKTTMTTSYFRL